MSDERDDLEAEYHLIVPVAEKFCKALAEQCEELIQTNGELVPGIGNSVFTSAPACRQAGMAFSHC